MIISPVKGAILAGFTDCPAPVQGIPEVESIPLSKSYADKDMKVQNKPLQLPLIYRSGNNQLRFHRPRRTTYAISPGVEISSMKSSLRNFKPQNLFKQMKHQSRWMYLELSKSSNMNTLTF